MKNQTRFISEISSNHLNNWKRCKKFIDVSKKIGCYGIKFQLFNIEKIFSPEVLSSSKQHRRRKKWELNYKLIPKIYKYCKKKKIKFGCTPFDLEAVSFLKKYIDFYKISSYDLLRLDLIKQCSISQKPVILSTGMASSLEIFRAVKVLLQNKSKDITVLRCTSNYPTLPYRSNLKSLETLNEFLKKKFKSKKFNVGWSDHTRNEAVIYRAVHRYDSKVIEFHLDLDRKGPEFKFGHCWLPREIERVIKNINIGYISDGSSNLKYDLSETKERKWRADPDDGLRPLKKIRKIL